MDDVLQPPPEATPWTSPLVRVASAVVHSQPTRKHAAWPRVSASTVVEKVHRAVACPKRKTLAARAANVAEAAAEEEGKESAQYEVQRKRQFIVGQDITGQELPFLREGHKT